MNRLANEKRTQVVAAMVEGASIDATCCMTGVAKHTVLKLLKGDPAMEAGLADHVWTVEELRGRLTANQVAKANAA
jgi:hypothetical protein